MTFDFGDTPSTFIEEVLHRKAGKTVAKSYKFDKQNQECSQDLWEMLVFCSKSLIQNFLFLCKH